MRPRHSQFFHSISKDKQLGHPPIPQEDRYWPKEWKTTYHKTYPRFEKIDLSRKTVSADFSQLIKNRQSRRDFFREPITKDELSYLLEYSCGDTSQLNGHRRRRAQPSGGARFPIEVYPFVLRSSNDLKSGLYHYNVSDHQLDVMWKKEFSDEDLASLFTYKWVQDAALVLIMTAVFWRTQNKYGERGYRYILLEAGHIGQNIYLASEALALKCCALAGTKDEQVEKLLDIDGATESLIYAMVVGR